MAKKRSKPSSDVRYVFKKVMSEFDIKSTDDITIDMFMFVGLAEKMCSMYSIRESVSEETICKAIEHANEMITGVVSESGERFITDFMSEYYERSIDILFRIITRVEDYRRIFGSVSRPKKEKSSDEMSDNTNSDVADKKHENAKSESHISAKEKNIAKSKLAEVMSMKGLYDLNREASEGVVKEFYGGEAKYEDVFSILSKKTMHNVIVYGNKQSGKTTFVRNIANKVVSGEVPESMKNAKVVLMDLFAMMTSSLRSGAETTVNSLTIAAEKSTNKVILIIDNAEDFFQNNSRFGEGMTDGLFYKVLNCNNILTILAMNKVNGKSVISENRIGNRFASVSLDDVSEYENDESIRKAMESNIGWRGFSFSEDTIAKARKMSMTEPESSRFSMICNILDLSCSEKTNGIYKSEKIRSMENEISETEERISKLSSSKSEEDGILYDELAEKVMSLSGELKNEKKRLLLSHKVIELSAEDITPSVDRIFNRCASGQIDGGARMKKLRSIETELKKHIIGQDEHIDIVCKAIKRKMVGLSDEKKPTTIFVAGSTGVGKTLLAKKLSEYLFGEEIGIVRIDMSEYSDKMSVNKLYGSAPGYVGYEEGGVLTNAIKNKPRCILLLDEIEKAHDDVFNVFLQVFDEGRLTDNKGGIVDFSNVIIMMTSNIGSYESEMARNQVGFARLDKDISSKSAIKNAMKRRFKPEFINRIDEVVFFNSLTDEDKKRIIRLELDKVYERIERKGFEVDREGISDAIVERIMENIGKEKEYGARPVVREVQRCLQDIVVDYIIDNEPEKGFVFSKELLFRQA